MIKKTTGTNRSSRSSPTPMGVNSPKTRLQRKEYVAGRTKEKQEQKK